MGDGLMLETHQPDDIDDARDEGEHPRACPDPGWEFRDHCGRAEAMSDLTPKGRCSWSKASIVSIARFLPHLVI